MVLLGPKTMYHDVFICVQLKVCSFLRCCASMKVGIVLIRVTTLCDVGRNPTA